jgi:hypothetical protein
MIRVVRQSQHPRIMSAQFATRAELFVGDPREAGCCGIVDRKQWILSA